MRLGGNKNRNLTSQQISEIKLFIVLFCFGRPTPTTTENSLKIKVFKNFKELKCFIYFFSTYLYIYIFIGFFSSYFPNVDIANTELLNTTIYKKKSEPNKTRSKLFNSNQHDSKVIQINKHDSA